MSEYDDRITEPVAGSEDEYSLASGAAWTDAVAKLGVIEDLIESGELMTPEVKQNDTVYFIFRNTVVLEGTVESIFSQYDETDEKYYYYVRMRNSFYGVLIQFKASTYGTMWFKTQAAAEAALLELQEEAEEQSEPGGE